MDYTSADPEKPESDFRWERKPHPMCIPHIVDSILAYLNVPDLKSCRLVSSQYNEIACKTLQREETITFKNIPQLETYLSNIKPISKSYHYGHPHHRYSASLYSSSDLSSLSLEPGDSEGDFYYGEKIGSDVDEEGGEVDCWSYFDNPMLPNCCDFEGGNYFLYPVKSEEEGDCQYRYSHSSFHFDYCDPSEEIEPIEQFFSTFGPQIRRLKYTTDLLPYNFPRPVCHMGEIWQDRLSNLEELNLEMKWGVPANLFSNTNEEDPRRGKVMLPSLKKLYLDVLLTDRDADRAQLFFHELLAVTPNLTEITIPGSKRFFDDYINVVLARVIISSEVEVPHLSVLNFCLALSDSQMRLLTQKNLPLSTVILDLEDMLTGDGGEDDNNEQDGAMEDEFGHRPSFTPILKLTLQRFFQAVATTLRSLHVCFPQSPRHNLHKFTFLQEMTLTFLALGYFAGSSQILDQLPALKKLELWNVQFSDRVGQGSIVPDKYQGITSVIL